MSIYARNLRDGDTNKQIHEQSLDSWVDKRMGELVKESLRRIEDRNPARSAVVQAAIDWTEASMRQRRKNR